MNKPKKKIGRDQLEKAFKANMDRYIKEWSEFLRFESISTDPAYRSQSLACADWTVKHLESIGFQTELLSTPTFPVAYGEYIPENSQGVIAFYGHYDVQPVDPLELWETGPFEPTLRNGRLYARGAEDNKGQVFFVLKALETLIEQGALPYTVRVFIEGEEESQSKGLALEMRNWKDKLKSDVLLVCDTGSNDKDILTVTMGLRGVMALSVKLYGANTDLHSGLHGGVAPNPAQGICELLASLHGEDGSVAVEGFYDDVQEVPQVDKEAAEKAAIADEVYERMVGVPPVGGEKNYSQAMRRGLRPTLEINGVVSGYGGAGTKTVIPKEATGKLTARLVAGQDPIRVMNTIKEHLTRNVPAGMHIEFDEEDAIGGALRLSTESEAIKKAGATLKTMNEGEVSYLWEGASVPIVAELAEVSGAQTVLVGFGLQEDNIHAPNESFSLEQLRKGYIFAGLFLQDCI